MQALNYHWSAEGIEHEMLFVPVPGTSGKPFPFGSGQNRRMVEVRDFYMSSTQVTQAFWKHVMGSNPSARVDLACPVENISWDHICGAGGFLETLNSGNVRESMAGADSTLKFRLPSETEWEYAARGGPHWPDGFVFSGSNDPDEVAWYGRRFSDTRRLVCKLLGWRLGWRLTGRGNKSRPSRTHAVATKRPNQLGLFDMSGNVFEWCLDVCVDDLGLVPGDGSPWLGDGDERRLRGGCYDNWDLHCTVSWRYGIVSDAHDGCLGFRLALAPDVSP